MRAKATLVGQICRVALDDSGKRSASDCIENEDASSNDPIFTMQLRRVDATSWQVSLPTPKE